MSKRKRTTKRIEQRISVRGAQREQPDVKKISQALIALAIAQAEKDAQAAYENVSSKKARGRE